MVNLLDPKRLPPSDPVAKALRAANLTSATGPSHAGGGLAALAERMSSERLAHPEGRDLELVEEVLHRGRVHLDLAAGTFPEASRPQPSGKRPGERRIDRLTRLGRL